MKIRNYLLSGCLIAALCSCGTSQKENLNLTLSILLIELSVGKDSKTILCYQMNRVSFDVFSFITQRIFQL